MIEPVNTPIIQDLSYKPVTITIDNVYMRIDGMDQDEEIELWKQLSFKVEIYGQQQVYWRHLFNRKTKKSYAGLFNYVKEFLDEREIPIKLIDHRINNPTLANFGLVEYIDDAKTIKLEPRPYQKEIIDNCSNRTIIQAATGAGKTFLMAALIAKFNVKPVCVFADKIGLCTQLKDEFEKFLGVEVGLVGDGIEDYKDITVISLQSAKEEYIKNANMIMFDECLSADQRILMGDGITYKTIKELVDNNVNETVMSFNHETNNFEPKPIISHSKIPLNDKKMMKLTIRKDDGTVEILECTNNHKIWIEEKQQYVMAEELIVGQTIMSIKK